MKSRLIAVALALTMILVLLSGCREPNNSANGDNLTPDGVKITAEK